MAAFKIEEFMLDFKVDPENLKSEVDSPTFIEGLLGVGHVGLIAGEHLVDDSDFEKIADVYSPHFNDPFSPGDTPGVVYSDTGTAKLQGNELFYSSEKDIFVYTGLYQGDYCEFYYQHANLLIDFCDE